MQTRVLLDFPFPDERVFRYEAMQTVLHHLVNNPLEEFTQQELATVTGADVSSISRSIDLLEQLGVVTVGDGRPSQIRIDPDHLEESDPLFAIQQPAFRKPVQAYCTELADRISASDEVEAIVGIVLFGSVARGTADRRSDIDLLVVLDGDATYGRRICTQLARELEEERFDGHRYEFEVLVETPASAKSHGENLAEIFDNGLVLDRTDRLSEIRRAVYADSARGE